VPATSNYDRTKKGSSVTGVLERTSTAFTWRHPHQVHCGRTQDSTCHYLQFPGIHLSQKL